MRSRLWCCLLALCAACAGPSYVAGRRVPPAVPRDVRHDEFRMDSGDGLKLLVQSWRPREGKVRGVVVIVHGLKDYGDRYAGFAQELTRRGYVAYAMDLRGHGDSEGDRVVVGRFRHYLEDLERLTQRVRLAEPGRPLFLFGHSMGGAIVTLDTLMTRQKPDGLVLSAAALQSDASVFLTAPLHVFSVIAPRLAVFSLDDAKFSRDPEVVANVGRDPLIYDGKAPARTAAELLSAMGDIQSRERSLNVPLLALHGTADVVTSPEGSRQLVARAKTSDKTLKLYPGLYHDLLHEPEHAQVSSDILDWLDAHTQTRTPARVP